jgi:hypothetical protein
MIKRTGFSRFLVDINKKPPAIFTAGGFKNLKLWDYAAAAVALSTDFVNSVKSGILSKFIYW